MYTDLFGKQRYKVNLHTHTSLSDGRRTPEEVIEFYRTRGYDTLALTDHWYFGKGDPNADVVILSGAEYNVGGADCRNGVYHIVGIGMEREPSVTRSMDVQQLIDAIHAAGGIAVLAHPAWSLNTPEKILKLKNVDATEIYNSVSNAHMSRRADSSLIVDMIASEGRNYPLLATDDAHFYDGTDAGISWIMAEAESNTAEALKQAIREKKFYATQGPEIHLLRNGDSFTVHCSPCREIIFHSNLVWCRRVFEGDGITEATYTPQETECFIRAEVVDQNGKRAWSNIMTV